MDNRNERIMKYAADKSGKLYPVDSETRDISEKYLRSFDDGVNWANGKDHGLIKINREWLKELQRKADNL